MGFRLNSKCCSRAEAKYKFENIQGAVAKKNCCSPIIIAIEVYRQKAETLFMVRSDMGDNLPILINVKKQ